MYEAFDLHLKFSPECFNKYPRLVKFYERMDSLERLKHAKQTRKELDPALLNLIEESRQ